jgi:hypothetical protein
VAFIMTLTVYANDREVASKAADGSSLGAVDVCFSPGAPRPGVPIPYANACHAPDIDNGSRTVFTKGKEIALEDRSYFAVSFGDEPATRGLNKGVVSGNIKGKCYFVSWSPNVKVEGLSVTRHQDLVTHNHSNPANTALFPYISRPWLGSHACQREEDRINRACGREADESEYKKPLRNRRRLFPTLPNRQQTPWHWTNDHCDGLQFANNSPASQVQEYMNNAQNAYREVLNYLTDMNALGQIMLEYAQSAGLKIAAKILVKAGVKQAGGSAVPLLGNIAMGLWTVWDVVTGIGDINEINRVVNEYAEQIRAAGKSATDLGNLLNRYRNLPPGESMANMMGDVQEAIAVLNPCTRARKCNLVPYDNKPGGRRNEPSTRGRGCCPGQTGHHLIPGAMSERGGCPGYNHGNAPTVCVESANQHSGSHGRVHRAMDARMRAMARAGRVQGGRISLDSTIDAAVRAHESAFPLSHCRAGCIRAQLEDYYRSTCPNAQLHAVDRNGSPITPTPATP